MKTLFRTVLFFLRIIRYVLDWILEAGFHWYYQGKQEKLPHIESDVIFEPGHVIAGKIRRREISSLEVVKTYIQRIHQVQPILNAVVEERFSEALEEALRVDAFLADSGKTEEEIEQETPLLGVPITIKEAIAVKGCLFTVGLPARKGLRAARDSDAASLLKQAGAIPLAITITPELCFWWESYNTLYGRCSNPYDTTRTSGGSSGGEGSIVGSAGSVIGIGNDIGGSIRIPASFNGIFGHKPSRGVVSNVGQFPTSSPGLQAFLMTGPMCRYASDLMPVLKILAPNHANKLKLNEEVNFRNLKIYYIEDDGGNPLVSAVHPEILEAQGMVFRHFQEAYGVSAVRVRVPNMARCFEAWAHIITTSGMEPVEYEITGRTKKASLLVELFKFAIGASDHIFPVLFLAMSNKLLKLRSEKDASKYFQMTMDMESYFEKLLGHNGIFICPTNPDFALHHHQALLKGLNMTYTALFNLTGLPVTQCPVTLSKSGLPIGLQVVSGLYNDHVTIAVAEELERVFGGWVNPSPNHEE